MSTTGRDVIRRSLQLLGVVAAGAAPTAQEYADGLLTLNDMVYSWATESLTIYTQSRTLKVLSAGVQTYTIGAGGSISVERPLWVANAGIIPATTPPGEIQIQILTDAGWAAIATKDLTSTFPSRVYYDYGFNASGYGTVTVWPIPTTAPTLVLYLPTAIATFADGTTPHLFPPGYERMLRYNLAVELAAEYGKPLNPVVVALATSSKAEVKRANNRMDDLTVDPALSRRGTLFNWRTGEVL